ncbi:protein-tyrosine-phosphatase MKP1-like [Senna tora]|uniref:Protein-tyrosine-phosphatase MKP1-like n=1 Tax=Senna tora TaxID=362788 RepID=A0A834WGZ4_9FABA|nr:protein-tyrosine-phosphatase MKP1-like [Senna tora]
MVGKEDARAPCQLSGSPKMFWRSASWSSSRSSALGRDGDEKDFADPDGNMGNFSGQNRRFPPVPLTPRSQQNCKARSCLPPLQPLSIARRSLDEWPKASSDDIGEWPQPPTPSGRGNGERLKLDLSSIQRNPDKNGGLVKRDKIAFFDKECSKVAQHIYLGGDAVARDRDILKQNGITHILNCVGFVCPEYFKADFVYRTLWLQDSPSEDITSILYDVFDYFEDVREQGGKVFVHCCQGVSRSTSLVIAYLMWREGQSFDDAFQYVKAARGKNCEAIMERDARGAVVSSSLSNFSNLSLLASNCTSQPLSDRAEVHGVKFTSGPYSQSSSSALKKPLISLAERRGSLSKSLKLPLTNDKPQVINRPPTFCAIRGDGFVVNSKHDDDRGNSILQCPIPVKNMDYKEVSYIRNCGEPLVCSSSTEDLKSTTSNKIDKGGLSQSTMTQTLVYDWPSLEKIVTFRKSHLDSKSAFVIYTPNMGLGKHAENVLYFWVGQSFNCDASQAWLDSDRESDYLRAVDWNQIGCSVLAQFSLPEDTIIKEVA